MILKNDLQNKNDIKLIIFDIDGTLVRFKNLEELMKRVYMELELEYTNESYLKYVKAVANTLEEAKYDKTFNFKKLCSNIDNEKFITKNKTKDFLTKMITYESDYIEIINGAREVLDDIYTNKEIICSTNWFLSSQNSKLEKTDLRKYINNIYTCENTVAKPNIHHFLNILNKEKIKPSEAIMIGDSLTDIPNEDIGLQTILFDENNSKEKIYEQATCVITQLNDISKILGLTKIKDKK